MEKELDRTGQEHNNVEDDGKAKIDESKDEGGDGKENTDDDDDLTLVVW